MTVVIHPNNHTGNTAHVNRYTCRQPAISLGPYHAVRRCLGVNHTWRPAGVRAVFDPDFDRNEHGVQIFSLAIAIQNLVWGIIAGVWAVADKYGAWRVAAFGLLVFATGLLSMAMVVNEAGIFWAKF